MAENETLDVCNRRFRWVVADILRRRPAVEIAEKLVSKVCGAWNYVRRNGFDVIGVLGRVQAGHDFDHAAVRDTGGSDLAHLIKLHADPSNLQGAVLDAVNKSALEMVLDSGFQQVAHRPDGPSVDQASSFKRQILAAAESSITDITNSLLRGSDVPVRARFPKAIAPTAPISAVPIPFPAALLGQSLLPLTYSNTSGV